MVSFSRFPSRDGLRIDSAKHQEKSFWPGFEDAAGVYVVGEVFNGDPAYVAPFQDYMSGILDYPRYVFSPCAPYALLLTRGHGVITGLPRHSSRPVEA